MISPTDSELVAEFIGYHRMALDGESILRRQGAEWGPDFLGELAYDDPARCWRVAKAVALQDPSDDVLMSLGVALSTLLGEHPQTIEVISTDVEADNRLHTLLSWVMADERIPQTVWLTIEELSKCKS
jgi:hypothetical protein